MFAWLVPALLPVSFREDDAGYLAWAVRADSPADCFDPVRGLQFGMFRPVVNLWWYGLVRVAGFEPFWYHVALCLLYAAHLGAFWFAAREIGGREVGWLAVGCWLGVFYFLQHILFWYSGYVYLLETVFLSLAAGFAARAVREGGAAIWWAVLCHVCAVLAKEPAALILPGIYAGLMVASSLAGGFRRELAPLAAAAVAGVLWVVLKPGLGGRLGFVTAWQDGVVLGYVLERWSFYAGFLAGGLGKVLWAGFALGLVRALHPRRPWLVGCLVVGAVVLSAFVPAVGLVVLAVVSILWFWFDWRVAPALAWFWLPLCALLLVDFQTRTYLFEGSLGGALALALALAGLPGLALGVVRRRPWLAVLPVAAALAAAAPAWHLAAPKLAALRSVTAVRSNFTGLTTQLAKHHGAILAVPDYATTGLDYEKDVLYAPDEVKAQRQKPMRPHDLETFLGVLGVPFEPWSPSLAGRPALVVLMTTHEVAWWDEQAARHNLVGEVVWQAVRDGQQARLLRVADAASLRVLFRKEP